MLLPDTTVSRISFIGFSYCMQSSFSYGLLLSGHELWTKDWVYEILEGIEILICCIYSCSWLLDLHIDAFIFGKRFNLFT